MIDQYTGESAVLALGVLGEHLDTVRFRELHEALLSPSHGEHRSAPHPNVGTGRGRVDDSFLHHLGGGLLDGLLGAF